MILAAQLRADALADRGDHLVGDVEAVGLVDAAEIVDRRQQEAARGAQLDGLLDASASSTSVRRQRFISPVSGSKRER